MIPNYSERWRYGELILTAFIESTEWMPLFHVMGVRMGHMGSHQHDRPCYA